MKYLSVCSGIEAATVAWHPLGWKPVGFAEIEKFPCAVLAHHYPEVPNFGDLNKYREWDCGRFDILVGGTPCQSFSVAGLRAGLVDPRGNLALTYVGLLARHKPRWFVWENVPGVLSIDGGRAFGSLLGAMAQLGYGFAYRVLDAQYVRVDGFPRAVPQRRRRVFVVGYLGDWRRAAAVLFDRESLSGNPAPCRETRQDDAPTVAKGLRASDGGIDREDAHTLVTQAVANPLTHRMYKGVNTTMDEGQTMVARGRTVRRLTSVECERLQGFPDGYTEIPWGKGPMPDNPRYKALGNSMAVNVMRWIGRRIELVENHDAD